MKSITLEKPLEVGGKRHCTLNMRPATIGDEEDAQVMAVDMGKGGVSMTMELCLFSIVAGVPYDDIRALPPYELRKLRAAYDELNAPPRPIARGKAKPQEKPLENPDDTAEPGTTPPQD